MGATCRGDSTAESFWLVWREGGGPPTVRHPDRGSALTAAVHLSNKQPQDRFYVLKGELVVKAKVSTTIVYLKDGG